jgi:hypothetical protein
MKNAMMMLAASALVLGSTAAFAADTAPAKPAMGVQTASASAPQDARKAKHGKKKKEVKTEGESTKQ